ncbi:protein involved in utilization of DNA as a carbon source [Escherichia coli]|nr:protein involved in utilization of DNA as a carbon source [Escherichia coli]
MDMLFDWWFVASPRLRQLCWAFWLLMLVTLIFLSSTHQEERDALIRLRASHHQQWAALYRLVDTTPFSEEKTLPFSPLDFQFARRANWFPGIHPRREVSWR